MDNMENLVEQTENVVVTTEETPKTFTQEDVDRMVKEKLDEVLPSKIARREAKLRKEYEEKYGRLENALRAGTGKDTVEEQTETLEKFYESKGIKIQKKPTYSDRDMETLARRDAEDIISGGYEEVVEETDRLSKKGIANMTAREKALFKTLAEHRQSTERGRELSKIGVTEDVYNSQEFKDFASKFSASTPIKDVYDIYAKTKPRKDFKTAGSMKQTVDNGVKDYYSPEEIDRLSMKDLDDPRVWEAVRRSMTGQ